jgi:phenylalanyl-tRNA synthetase beta chain
MKISRDWLTDLIDLGGISDADLATRMTEIGHAVEGIEAHDGDTVFEVEFTTNRIDAMSHKGLARELSAALGRPMKTAAAIATFDGSDTVPIRIDAPELCSRYTGLVIRGVTPAPSSPRVARRLEAVGLRPINNIVDATNYVMLAYGHPLHAFDLDLLGGPAIVVRAAARGETLKTLDGVDRKLDPEMVVIADGVRGVALGGVMGGENSEIRDETKNVLLECAHFNPPTIRRMSRRLGLFTDASYRFERGIDPNDTIEAISACAAHIVAESGGSASKPIDVVARVIEPKTLVLRAKTIDMASAGLVDLVQSKKLLEPIGMASRLEGESLEVTVPTWRGDVGEEMDLVEEVLRLYGFNRIPSTLPRVTTGDVRKNEWVDLEDELREILSGSGLSEVVTYSFIHPAHNAVFTDESPLEVQNALTENLSVMRLSLFPGLLETLAHNWSYGVRDGAIFEIGRSYHRDGEGVKERHHAAFLLFGNATDHWSAKGRPFDYFDGKGLVENVCKAFHLEPAFRATSTSWLADGAAAVATAGDRTIATLGMVSRDTLQKFEIGAGVNVVMGSIDIGAIAAGVGHWEMEPVSKFPGVPMVIAMMHAPDLDYGTIVETIRSMEIPYLQEIGVWDRFVPEKAQGEVKTALGLWYQATDRSLSQEDVAAAHETLAKGVAERLPVRLIT